MTASVGVVAAPAPAHAASAATVQAASGNVPGEGDPVHTGGVLLTDETEPDPEDAAGPAAKQDAAQGGTAKRTARLSKAAKQRIKAKKAVKIARKQVGAPYRYGAAGPHAFDCSGLTSYAWRKAGVRIPRVAAAQYRSIKKKVSWKQLQPGDLLFFRGLGHVGMYVGKGKWIHSPRSGQTVRIEKLTGYRKRAFAGAVRPGL